jgi:hypothetical protein
LVRKHRFIIFHAGFDTGLSAGALFSKRMQHRGLVNNSMGVAQRVHNQELN